MLDINVVNRKPFMQVCPIESWSKIFHTRKKIIRLGLLFYSKNAESKSLPNHLLCLSSVILGWKAKINNGGSVIRKAIGQHYINIAYIIKPYNHPNMKQVKSVEYSVWLKIFESDINVLEKFWPGKDATIKVRIQRVQKKESFLHNDITQVTYTLVKTCAGVGL